MSKFYIFSIIVLFIFSGFTFADIEVGEPTVNQQRGVSSPNIQNETDVSELETAGPNIQVGEPTAKRYQPMKVDKITKVLADDDYFTVSAELDAFGGAGISREIGGNGGKTEPFTFFELKFRPFTWGYETTGLKDYLLHRYRVFGAGLFAKHEHFRFKNDGGFSSDGHKFSFGPSFFWREGRFMQLDINLFLQYGWENGQGGTFEQEEEFWLAGGQIFLELHWFERDPDYNWFNTFVMDLQGAAEISNTRDARLNGAPIDLNTQNKSFASIELLHYIYNPVKRTKWQHYISYGVAVGVREVFQDESEQYSFGGLVKLGDYFYLNGRYVLVRGSNGENGGADGEFWTASLGINFGQLVRDTF